MVFLLKVRLIKIHFLEQPSKLAKKCTVIVKNAVIKVS